MIRMTVTVYTDLDTCCSSVQDRSGRDHRGNWIPPGSDSRLSFHYEASGDFHKNQHVVEQLYLMLTRHLVYIAVVYIPTNAACP